MKPVKSNNKKLCPYCGTYTIETRYVTELKVGKVNLCSNVEHDFNYKRKKGKIKNTEVIL